MEGVAVPSMQGVEHAALALHRAEHTGADLVALLEHTVVELGLAARAHFVRADRPRAAGPPEDPAAIAVEVQRPETSDSPAELEGVLYCSGLIPGALPSIEVLAAHTGLAFATVQTVREIELREESVRRVAERLQDSLLPNLPTVNGLSVAVQYRAAAREARVGGDFYDLFELPDGRLLIVVGDVMGKGVEAAGRTSLITQTLRALALQELPLEQLLERADQQVSYQDPDLMATVWCGLYEPDTGELTFASLGHPPALLVRADDEPIRLTMEGLPLGMRDLTGEAPECRDRQLQARDLLVLYTDGVVEASGDYIAGQEALREAITQRRDEPLEALLEAALSDLLAEAGHTDDAVMFLLRRR